MRHFNPWNAPCREQFDKCTCGDGPDGERIVCVGCREFNRDHDEWLDAKDKFNDRDNDRADYLRDMMKDDDVTGGGR